MVYLIMGLLLFSSSGISKEKTEVTPYYSWMNLKLSVNGDSRKTITNNGTLNLSNPSSDLHISIPESEGLVDNFAICDWGDGAVTFSTSRHRYVSSGHFKITCTAVDEQNKEIKESLYVHISDGLNNKKENFDSGSRRRSVRITTHQPNIYIEVAGLDGVYQQVVNSGPGRMVLVKNITASRVRLTGYNKNSFSEVNVDLYPDMTVEAFINISPQGTPANEPPNKNETHYKYEFIYPEEATYEDSVFNDLNVNDEWLRFKKLSQQKTTRTALTAEKIQMRNEYVDTEDSYGNKRKVRQKKFYFLFAESLKNDELSNYVYIRGLPSDMKAIMLYSYVRSKANTMNYSVNDIGGKESIEIKESFEKDEVIGVEHIMHDYEVKINIGGKDILLLKEKRLIWFDGIFPLHIREVYDVNNDGVPDYSIGKITHVCGAYQKTLYLSRKYKDGKVFYEPLDQGHRDCC